MNWYEGESRLQVSFTLSWNEESPYPLENSNYPQHEINSTSGIIGYFQLFAHFYSYTISGLKSNRYYHFRANAVNVAGAGPASNDVRLATSKRN